MQKNGKKLLAWMLAASMVFSFSMPTQAAKKKPALSKKKAVITVGKTLTLRLKIKQEDKSNMEEQKKENCDSFQERKSESEKGGDSEDYSKFPLSGQEVCENLQGYGEKEKDSSCD